MTLNIGEANAAQRLLDYVTSARKPRTLGDWAQLTKDAALLADKSSKVLAAGMSADEVTRRMVAKLDAQLEPRRCRVCGCTDEHACDTWGCWWVHQPDELPLCSSCQGGAEAAVAAAEDHGLSAADLAPRSVNP